MDYCLNLVLISKNGEKMCMLVKFYQDTIASLH